MILFAALSLSDARLYEAADSLGTSEWRKFMTITLPGARYGLISATMVVFTMAVSEFGVPKVIGGNYNVLAIDVYKQVIGQQNFNIGAVVGLILLAPAVTAYAID
jgi:iron(III) transport system permease protein